MNTQDVIRLIQSKGEEIMSKIITDQLLVFEPLSNQMKKDYSSYKGTVPIKNRTIKDSVGSGINNKLANDYRGEIVDQMKGYLLGQSIVVKYEGKDTDQKFIEDWNKLNQFDSLNETTEEYAATCGYGSRLCYVDLNGDIKVMNTYPWETHFIINSDTNEVQYAMIVYDWTVVDMESGKEKKTKRCEWYDNENVSIYVLNGKKWQLDKISLWTENGEIEKMNPAPHSFGFVPVIQIKNNENLMNDFFKVESLIDAYDRMISDAQNELEEFRGAYLKATGATMDEEERQKAKRTGVFNLPDTDSDVAFITKNLPVEYLKEHKGTLNENIYKFARAVEMQNSDFSRGGAESGEARKWRLLGLEFRAITKERKFSEGLFNMYKVLATAWNKGKYNFDPLNFEFQFTRSLPVDLLYAAQINKDFEGTISDETRLGLLPFIKNVADEMKKMEEEKAANTPIDFNTPPATQYDANGNPIDTTQYQA